MISKPDTVTLSLWVTFSYIKVDRSNRIRIDPSTVRDDAEWMFYQQLSSMSEICINTRRRCKLHFHTMISFTLSECSSQLGARSQQIRVGAASHVARWRTMRTSKVLAQFEMNWPIGSIREVTAKEGGVPRSPHPLSWTNLSMCLLLLYWLLSLM